MSEQERAIATRRRILRAAREEFAAKGLAGARVQAIATAAAANKERIYAYFGSKQGLYRAVLAECFAEINRDEAELLSLEEKDIPMLTTLLLTNYMAFNETRPWFWRILAWENLAGGCTIAELPHTRSDALAHLRALYTRGQEEGHFRDDVSFESYLLTLTAVAFFTHANQATMSQTLGLDLGHAGTKARLVAEILRLLQ